MIIEPWHWIVLGICLMVAEIFLPSFTILWFGLGSLLVAVALLLWPALPLYAQLALWGGATVALTIAWFRYFKPRMLDRTKAGLSREAAVGQVGMVIRAGHEEQRGVVRFSVPLLGQEEWPYLSRGDLAAGDRCRVMDVLGNALLVEKA
jgi:membrane protein implicated in regulation of membrane protease activity